MYYTFEITDIEIPQLCPFRGHTVCQINIALKLLGLFSHVYFWLINSHSLVMRWRVCVFMQSVHCHTLYVRFNDIHSPLARHAIFVVAIAVFMGEPAAVHWRSYMTVERAINARKKGLKFMVASLHCHSAASLCASFTARRNSVP